MLKEEVYFCLCQNDLKDEGLFSLEERRKILIEFYNVPKNKIVLLKNKEEIQVTVFNCEKIIRGIRSFQDIEEIEKLAEAYKLQEHLKQVIIIEVPDSKKMISSSKLIELIKNGKYNPKMNWVPKKLINLIKNKIKESG